MGMTMSQKILAYYAGKDSVKAGDLVECKLSLALANDVTAPLAIDEFNKIGTNGVFDKEKIALVPDHFTPNKDIASATQAKKLREFAKKEGIVNYFEIGQMGVEHALLPEKGLTIAGDLIIGADSHTCTYGALGAFSTGVGSTDLGCAMATGTAWFKVPEAILFILNGKLNKGVTGKDLILHIIGMIGVDGARYASMEFAGDGVKTLTIDDRFTISNMAIEAGAKNGIFPADSVALEYCASRTNRKPLVFEADADATYIKTIEIDLSQIELTVAFPHLPENAKTITEAQKLHVKLDQVIIGSCTNGRISDMENAANILKGKKVHPDIRCIVIPATQEVFHQCMTRGYMEIFLDSGCAVSTPTCGPCLGGHMGILAKGERSLATTNRNFVGRMGHKDSEVYLASPSVAAASAIAGYIVAPEC